MAQEQDVNALQYGAGNGSGSRSLTERSTDSSKMSRRSKRRSHLTRCQATSCINMSLITRSRWRTIWLSSLFGTCGVIVNTFAEGDSAAVEDVRHRYVFRIANGKWFETGMFGETVGEPELTVYTRPQLPDGAMKELGYLVGNWTTEGRVGNIKSTGDWITKWAPGYDRLTIDTGFTSEGSVRAGRSVGLVGWDSKNEKIVMHNFWSFNESYTLSWKPVSDTVWEGELLGVENGKQFTTTVS